MNLKTMREAAPSADDVIGAYRAARGEMSKRRERYVNRNAKHLNRAAREIEKATKDVDLSSSAKAARAMSWRVRKDLASRIHPQPRRRRSFGAMLVGVCLGTALGYLVADRRNRERLAGYAQGLSARAKPVMDDVVSRVRSGNVRQEVEEAAVQAEVQALLTADRNASGLRVAVEGRTVYLRGEAPAETARELSERIRQLPGVAAVVNLAMSSGPATPVPPVQAPTATPSS